MIGRRAGFGQTQAERDAMTDVGRASLTAALLLVTQLLVAGCSADSEERGGESHAPTTPAVTVLESSSDVSGPPTTTWDLVDSLHVKAHVPSLLVLAEREPHVLLAHEVRAIKKCLSLNEVVSNALLPAPASVIEAVAALVDVCQGLSELKAGDVIQAAEIAELSAALSRVGDLLWPT